MSDNQQNQTSTKKEDFFYFLDTSVKTLVIMLLIFAFVLSPNTIMQTSMLPTLQEGDKVIVYQFMYKPKRGDIVIVTQPNDMNHNLVKRVIATGGQTVNIDAVAGKVYVDNEELDEPYILEPTYVAGNIKYPFVVPEGTIFVMGDNRNVSLDSRSDRIGVIDERYIRGKVWFRIYPFNRIGVVK